MEREPMSIGYVLYKTISEDGQVYRIEYNEDFYKTLVSHGHLEAHIIGIISSNFMRVKII